MGLGGGWGIKTNLKPRAVIKEQERERELQICAAEKPLLVKIQFEEVSLKANFEGGEGRAVTESERKRIPDFGQQKSKRHDHHAVFF